MAEKIETGKRIATRDSYGNALTELGAAHSDLVVLTADLAAATKTGIFQKAFPERHFNCGIAEATRATGSDTVEFTWKRESFHFSE